MPYTASSNQLAILRERRRNRRIVRDLYEGRWFFVLITLARTAHRFRDVRTHAGKLEPLFNKVNLIRLAVQLHADIIANRPVTTSVGEGFEAQAEAIAEIRRRCLFDARFHSAMLTTLIEAEAPLVSRFDQRSGGAVIEVGSNDQWIPIGEPGADGQPTVWEKRWTVSRGSGERRRRYLRVERHSLEDGGHVIEQEAYKGRHLDILSDLAELNSVPLAEAFDAGATVPAERELTGLTEMPVVQLVRYLDNNQPCPIITEHDLDIVDTLAAAFSRLDRVLELHGNPMLRVSEQMLDEDGKLKMDELEAIEDPEGLVGYVLANFKFSEMLSYVERMTELFLAGTLSVSPSLIGIKLSGGATPDAVDKLRLESMNTMTAANRAVPYISSAVGRAFTTASQIEANRPLAGFAVSPVEAKVTPELPVDEQQRKRDVAETRDLGLLDQLTALEEAHGPEKAAMIYERIQEDRAAEAQLQRASVFGAVPPIDDGGGE